MQSEKINNLKLPSKLLSDSVNGGYKIDDNKQKKLEKLFKNLENISPHFFSYDQIKKESESWVDKNLNEYLGSKHEQVQPGHIDLRKCLIIGMAEEDSPLGLDYRTTVPSVIYFGDLGHECYWFKIADSYPDLISFLEE